MPRPPAFDKSVSVTIRGGDLGTGRAEEGGGPLEGGLTLLNRFDAEINDPGLPYLVTLTLVAHERQLVAESLRLTMREGRAPKPITSEGLRAVKVAAYVARVRSELGSLGGGFLIVREETGLGSVTWSGVPSDDWSRFDQAQRSRRDPAEVLPVVAALYREAMGSSDPQVSGAPTQYVADKLHYSRGHAARLVTQAREPKRKLLRAAPGPGMSGEVPPRKERKPK